MKKKPATIVIVTCERLEKTKLSLQSLLDRTKYPYKLIIVDNNSADGTRDYLIKNYKWFYRLVLLNDNKGPARASNIGWSLGPKDYYVKFDNDIIVLKDNWLDALVALANDLKKYEWIGHSPFGKIFNKKIIGNHTIMLNPEMAHILGACTLITKKAFDTIGYWNSKDFGVYGWEEFDYGVRLRMAGLDYCYVGGSDYVKHIGIEMDEADPISYLEGKRKSRIAGEQLRYEILRKYKSGERSLKIMEPL